MNLLLNLLFYYVFIIIICEFIVGDNTTNYVSKKASF